MRHFFHYCLPVLLVAGVYLCHPDIDARAQNIPAPEDSTSAEQSSPLPPMPPMPEAATRLSTEKPVKEIPLRDFSTAPPEPAPARQEPSRPATPQIAAESTPGTDTEPVREPTDTVSNVPDAPAPDVTVPAAPQLPGATGAATAAGAAASAVQATAEAAIQAGGDDEDANAAGQQQPAVQQLAAPPKAVESHLFREELSLLNVPTGNLRTMKVVIDDDYNLRGLVYGEEQGYIRKLEANRQGDFEEVWKSPPLNSSVREIFVEDINNDKETDIVAYTANGNIFIFGYDSTEMVYRTPEGTYDDINCMLVANMDDDPQKELLFIAKRAGTLQRNDNAGNLIQFDTLSQFDEWTSSDLYTATDMVLGNIDNDNELEIILNTGEILSYRFKTIKWKNDVDFGSRLYLIDLDSDGILELVTEYNQSYVRVFDLDQRREKW